MTGKGRGRPYKQGCPDARTCSCSCDRCKKGSHCIKHDGGCHKACNK